MDRGSAVLGCLLVAVAVFCPARASAQAKDAQGRPPPPPGYTYDDAAPKAAVATDGDADRYYTETLAMVDKCGGASMNCYVEASPQRCKQTAVQMVGSPAMFQHTWVMCVRSCGDAGFTSRVLGDCRR